MGEGVELELDEELEAVDREGVGLALDCLGLSCDVLSSTISTSELWSESADENSLSLSPSDADNSASDPELFSATEKIEGKVVMSISCMESDGSSIGFWYVASAFVRLGQ